jgi:hypothetical protein
LILARVEPAGNYDREYRFGRSQLALLHSGRTRGRSMLSGRGQTPPASRKYDALALSSLALIVGFAFGLAVVAWNIFEPPPLSTATSTKG